jgi:hypothetical protein
LSLSQTRRCSSKFMLGEDDKPSKSLCLIGCVTRAGLPMSIIR